MYSLFKNSVNTKKFSSQNYNNIENSTTKFKSLFPENNKTRNFKNANISKNTNHSSNFNTSTQINKNITTTANSNYIVNKTINSKSFKNIKLTKTNLKMNNIPQHCLNCNKLLFLI